MPQEGIPGMGEVDQIPSLPGLGGPVGSGPPPQPTIGFRGARGGKLSVSGSSLGRHLILTHKSRALFVSCKIPNLALTGGVDWSQEMSGPGGPNGPGGPGGPNGPGGFNGPNGPGGPGNWGPGMCWLC